MACIVIKADNTANKACTVYPMNRYTLDSQTRLKQAKNGFKMDSRKRDIIKK